MNNGTIVDVFIDKFFSGLRRWDAIHFLHIARFGYIYETSLAFFPGYPLGLIRPLASLFCQILAEPTAYLFSSITINFLLGFANVYLLFQLALKYHFNRYQALWTSVLYMINPASVFFVAPYSETSFLFTQLLGHYYLKSNQIFFSSLCFAFGGSIRSNGIVSCGFIIYHYLKQIYQTKRFIFPIHYLILCLSPFVLVQYYQYKQFCFEKSFPSELKIYGFNENLPMALTNFSSEWCTKRIPMSYQYVQKTYWNVGFMQYWAWKQIPNFVLALPLFILILQFLRLWFQLIKKDLWKEKFNYLFTKKQSREKVLWLIHQDFLPHIIYTIFLSLIALFFMHVQVATRFLFSSGPLLYWISMDRVKQYNIENASLRRIFYLLKNEKFLFYYYVTYVIIGLFLFTNFLPWT